MAEMVGGALLSSFFQVAIQKLASSQFKDYFRRHKLDDKLVKKLEITLNSINQVLDDAEKKQYQSTYVKKWLYDLKHAVYETDLLFDEISTHAHLKKLKKESQTVTTKVRGFFSSSSNRFASRIKELLENLEFLAKQKKILGLGIVTSASNEGGVSWKLSERLPTTSLVDDSGIYGTRQALQECGNISLNEIPSNLKKASIYGTEIIESSLGQILCNSACLEELNVGDFSGPNLKYNLNLHSCNSLHTLSIKRLSSSSLPFTLDLFSNLHSLTLHDCPQLDSFPGNGLPLSLSRLLVEKCPKLIASRNEWSLFKLYSLKEFTVTDEFENVVSFPEENLLPPTIIHLRLKDCSKLRIMNYKGFFHLKSLQSLTIMNCPSLERLPEEALPDSLSGLSIERCPLLYQRYRKDEGDRWHKIRHIPSVTIWNL
ncbi:hypothetical protein VNO77_26815 [Canavalia gladiata]|uniref:Disease resistance N-terminal domain-containing protein n=1 Tax=Canavalia gladiata TaxID=3824 RepID=A0AAN9Q3N8_CANGL